MKLSSHQSNIIRRFSAFHTPLAWCGEGMGWGCPPPIGGIRGAFTGKILRFETQKSAFWRILGDDYAMMIHLLIQTHTKKELKMKYSTFNIKVHFFVKQEKQFENNVLKWFVFNDKLKV